MTLPKDIQSLIADLDSIFPVINADASQSLSQEESQKQEVLQKVRSYLQSMEEQVLQNESSPSESTATAIASAVISQINIQRGDWLNPLKMELETLRQQRESMISELNQLQGQRQALVSEFVNGLRDRCSEIVQETVENLRTQQANTTSAKFWTASIPNVSPAAELERVENAQFNHVENILQLQQQSDQMLLSLDSTLHQVLETLEKDLQAYQTSLSQDLKELYQLGRQPLLQEEVSSSSVSELSRESEPQSPEAYPFPGIEVEMPPGEIVSSPPQTSETDMESFPLQETRIESQISSLFDLDVDNLSSDSDISPQSEETSSAERQLFESDRFQKSQDEEAASGITAFDDPIIAAISGKREGTNSELFGGLDDPANNATPSSSPPQDLFTDQGSDAQPQPVGLDSELPQVPEEETVVTIESLMDLVDQRIFSTEDPESLEAAYGTSTEADGYVQVSPHENLLEVRESTSSQEQDLEQALDENTLQQITDDLQQFEEEGVETIEATVVSPEDIPEDSSSSSDSCPEEFLTDNQDLQIPLDQIPEEEVKEVEVEVVAEDEAFDSPWDDPKSSTTEDTSPKSE